MATSDYTSEQIQRFWSHVAISPNADECWEWQAALTIGKSGGYGSLNIKRKPMKAHRVAWEIQNGEIPNKLYVLHKCDNRKCCNPQHLFLGTHQNNMDDMYSKNRKAPTNGEYNGRHKLTAKQVNEIRTRYDCRNITQRELANEYMVGKSTINSVITGKNWK